MSTETSTMTRTFRNSQDSRAKRQRGVTAPPPSSEEDTACIAPKKKLTPIEAALASAESYYQSLHPGLQAILVPTLKECLKVRVSAHFKSRKHNEMLLDTDRVPSSCRKKLPLNVLPEVMESEGFITLEAQLALVLVNHEKKTRDLCTLRPRLQPSRHMEESPEGLLFCAARRSSWFHRPNRNCRLWS